MVARDDLRDSEYVKMRREVDELRSMITTGSTSITRPGSRLRVATEDGILAESVGGAPAIRVTGRQTVNGQLDGDGTLDWEGGSFLRGPVAITGATGTLTVDAETLLKGLTRLLADLRVQAGGKITVEGADGDTVISDSKITFANGAEIRAPGAGSVKVTYGTTEVVLQGGQAHLAIAGRRLIVDSNGFQFFNLPTKTVAGIPAGVMHVDVTGRAFRTT